LGWPRTGINKQQAAAFCNSIGGRLPTEAEWEFAARGPDNLLYPFGNEYDIEKATLRKISPPPLGQKPGGASWVGALDMSGGVSEWVQDWYGPFQVSGQQDPEGPEHGEYGLAKGGNWFAHASYLVRAAYRERLPAATANSTVGVRCVISVGG
jgi:iron(II)-dependent oxidoreductase